MMLSKSSFILQEEPGEFSLKEYQGHFCMPNIGVFRTAEEIVQFSSLNLLHEGRTGKCTGRFYVTCKACLNQPT